jgi:tRNA nucleotidyltransferase (CCA-adding enzyme)
MQCSLPVSVAYILWKLQAKEFEAYVVGGAVRDVLRNQPIDPEIDWDFTTNATPDQLQNIFLDAFYENTFGTVSITPHHLEAMMKADGFTFTHPLPPTPPASTRIIDMANATKLHISLEKELPADDEEHGVARDHGWPDYEITTFRTDGTYSDHRRPDEVSWGSSLHEDLERRDFTINAIAMSVSLDLLREHFLPLKKSEALSHLIELPVTLSDPFQGQEDLHHQVIRTVSDPTRRFREDALRMLRAVRLSVQLNYTIEPATLAAIQAHAADIQHVSAERIGAEFMKMMGSQYPAEAIELLDKTGLLQFILPELLEAKGVEQGGHHTTNVWTHSLDALAWCPSPDPVVRLATLLHDIAKPATFQRQKNTITFYNHEVIGARTAKKIAQRLRLSKRDCDRVFTLVRFHMFYYQPTMSDAAIRRFMRNVGLEHVDDILEVREGDRLGSGARRTSWRLEEMKQRMIEQLNQPMEVRDLAIGGNELMSELGLKPGRQLGEILNALFEQVLENPELNTAEKLLEMAKEIVERN